MSKERKVKAKNGKWQFFEGETLIGEGTYCEVDGCSLDGIWLGWGEKVSPAELNRALGRDK